MRRDSEPPQRLLALRGAMNRRGVTLSNGLLEEEALGHAGVPRVTQSEYTEGGALRELGKPG